MKLGTFECDKKPHKRIDFLNKKYDLIKILFRYLRKVNAFYLFPLKCVHIIIFFKIANEYCSRIIVHLFYHHHNSLF